MAISIKSNATVDSYILKGLLLESNVRDVWHLNMSGLVHGILTNSLPKSTIEKLEAVGISYSDDPAMQAQANLTTFAGELKDILADLPHGENFSSAMYITGIVLACITSVIVLLRIFSRLKLANGVRLEDWCILFALMMSLAFSSLMQHSTRYGGGTHVWSCKYSDIYWVSKCLFFCQFIYILGIVSVKASLLIFYFRLSPKLWYRYTVVGVAMFVGTMSFALLIAMIFQCKPIAFWNDFFGKKCFNMLAYWLAFGALSMISDVMIWVLPIPIVWRLGLSRKEKIIVTGLFSLGLLVCIASLIRLLSLSSFVKSVDFTSREGVTGIWSLTELDVAIICASVPALKGLFSAFSFRMPFSFRATGESKNSQPQSSYLTSNTGTAHHHNSTAGNSDGTAALDEKQQASELSVLTDLEASTSAAEEYRASIDSDIGYFVPPFGSSVSSRHGNRRSLGVAEGSVSASRSTLDEIPDIDLSCSPSAFGGLRPREIARSESRNNVDEEGNTMGPLYSHGVPLRAGLRKPSAVAGMRNGSVSSRKESIGSRKGSVPNGG